MSMIVMDEAKKGYLMCFGGVFTWSFSEIIVKLLQGSVGPVSLSFLRFFFGGLFLLLLMSFQKDLSQMFLLVRRYPKLVVISSVVGLGFSNIVYFYGIQLTQANVGSALYTTYPIFISIYSIFLLNERSNLKGKFIGYILGFIGTAILITNFNFRLFIQPENIAGNLLLVLAAALWAFYSVLGKKIFRKEAQLRDVNEKYISNIEIKFTAVSFFVSSIPSSIILYFTDEIPTFLRYAPQEWSLVLFLAFISTAFGLFIFFVGIRKIEVSKGMSLALLKPIMVSILAYFIIGETVSVALMISLGLVIFAVVLINRKSSKKVL